MIRYLSSRPSNSHTWKRFSFILDSSVGLSVGMSLVSPKCFIHIQFATADSPIMLCIIYQSVGWKNKIRKDRERDRWTRLSNFAQFFLSLSQWNATAAIFIMFINSFQCYIIYESVLIAFRINLSLYANYNVKPTWISCQLKIIIEIIV